VLNPFHGIKIIRPKDFEEILEDDKKIEPSHFHMQETRPDSTRLLRIR
jgi:hypothetical protein